MHNKVFLVDDQVVITGGRNIADEYFDFDHKFNYRDRDVLLVGAVVPDIKSSFSEYWVSDLSVSVEHVVDDLPEDIKAHLPFSRVCLAISNLHA